MTIIYKQRTDMNLETRVTLKYIDLLKKMDQFVLKSHEITVDNGNDEEFGGFVKTIKKFYHKQSRETYEKLSQNFSQVLNANMQEVSS